VGASTGQALTFQRMGLLLEGRGQSTAQQAERQCDRSARKANPRRSERKPRSARFVGHSTKAKWKRAKQAAEGVTCSAPDLQGMASSD